MVLQKKINESAEKEGWLVKVELSNIDEISDLMDEKSYLNSIQ